MVLTVHPQMILTGSAQSWNIIPSLHLGTEAGTAQVQSSSSGIAHFIRPRILLMTASENVGGVDKVAHVGGGCVGVSLLVVWINNCKFEGKKRSNYLLEGVAFRAEEGVEKGAVREVAGCRCFLKVRLSLCLLMVIF